MKSLSCFWSFREDGYYVENFTVPAGICLFFRNIMIVHPWSSAQSDQACCDFLVIAALCLLTVLSFHHFFFQMDCTSNPALIILSSNNFSLLHPPIHRLLLSSPYLCPPAVANPTVCRPSGLITHYYCLFTEKRVHRTAPHWSGSSLYRAQSPWRSMGQTRGFRGKEKMTGI